MEKILDFKGVRMRADRLLSMLMLLQARGRMTAQQLADELEVSVRTIYRDMDALSAAGVPVWAERGPGGGCSLLDSYRTTLTGLNQDEVRALFMLSIPAPLAELGVDQELRAALLKLSAALPASRRPDEERTRQRVHLDSAGWSGTIEPVPHLQTIHQAVWQDRKLHITCRLMFGAEAEWQVEPYGLVAKAGTWYLVCARDDHIRVHRLSRELEVRLLDETFERPVDFDLAAFWQAWCVKVERNRPRYPARIRVAPDLIPWLPRIFGEPIREQIAGAGLPDAEGWITLTLPFESLEAARERILSFGRAVEVLEPLALRNSVWDYAAQIVDLYTKDP
jgi:predicted DNA-binding transcriptional regulator YafY